jgi:hypothetical protein
VLIAFCLGSSLPRRLDYVGMLSFEEDIEENAS